MKYMNMVLLGLIVFSGCNKFVKASEHERMIRQVFTIQLSRDMIFDRALEWCAKKYGSINDVIIVKDREKGKIISKGTGKYSEYLDFLVDRQFGYTLIIEIKENRYRVTFDNFIVNYNERDLRSNPAEYQFEIDKIKVQLEKLSENLRDYISRGVSGEMKKEEEW